MPTAATAQPKARVGQKGQLTRQWARKGSRPRQPKDQRYKAAYLFAAVCPENEKSAALVLPKANTEAMAMHLAEISAQVTAGAHAILVLDQAGWHVAHDLKVPDNITLLFLPPYSPELNPIENLFQFLKHNYLNARVYDTYEHIVDACCSAWSSLLNINGQLKSITTRTWQKRSTPRRIGIRSKIQGRPACPMSPCHTASAVGGTGPFGD